MPWKVFKDGTQFCVHKLKPDGSKGPKVKGGCHASKEEAEAHKRALYRNVKEAAIMAGIHEAARAAALAVQEETGEEILVDRLGVEIVKTGIDYPAASGTVTFTPEDLADAVIAANDDPTLPTPRIGLGHTGPIAEQLKKVSDQPALGTVQNLRLTPDGQTLLGDFIGIPKWLDDILASAYPSRSIDGWFNWEGHGREYRLVIQYVDLLGIRFPGCTTLADIQALYSKEGPADLEVVEASLEGGAMTPSTVSASVQAEEVRRAFYDQVAVEDRFMWWIQAHYQEPQLLVAADADGKTYHVKYTFEGDEVNFSDPVPVKIQYVEEESGKVAADAAEPVAVFASRAESRENTLKKGEVACHVYSLTSISESSVSVSV